MFPLAKKQVETAQDNVALIVVLDSLEAPDMDSNSVGKRQLVCVANTHIHANPELKDVKLWQVSVLKLRKRKQKN